MATITASVIIEERSRYFRALDKSLPYMVSLPDAPPPYGGWPLLLFLHGGGYDHSSIVNDTVCRSILEQHQLAIVFPNGEEGWYLDSPIYPQSRGQSALRELLDEARDTLPVQSSTERTGICGWSMGGFGAVRFAEDYPQEVSAVASMMGLLDFPNPGLPDIRHYAVPAVMGSAPADWARINCLSGAGNLQGKPVLLVTGADAFDNRMNRNFAGWLSLLGNSCQFHELPGGHTFDIVRRSLPYVLHFMEAHLCR